MEHKIIVFKTCCKFSLQRHQLMTRIVEKTAAGAVTRLLRPQTLLTTKAKKSPPRELSRYQPKVVIRIVPTIRPESRNWSKTDPFHEIYGFPFTTWCMQDSSVRISCTITTIPCDRRNNVPRLPYMSHAERFIIIIAVYPIQY